MIYFKIKKLALTFIVFNVFMLQNLMADMLFYYSAAVLPSIISSKAKPKGILDTTFGTDGLVLHRGAAGGNGPDQGKSIARDTSGNIYVTGESLDYPTQHMVIWKYTPEGKPDTSFGIDGIVTYHGAAGVFADDRGHEIVLDPSGNIYVVGRSYIENISTSMVIWKYTPEGDLDTSFADGGIVVENGAYGYSLTLDTLGNIYAVGYKFFNDTYDDMMIWKYTPEGDLDTTFGTGGIVSHHSAAGGDLHDTGWSIALDSSNNVYVSGWSYNGVNNDMVIWKYTSAGVLDTTFGTGGIVVHNNAAGGNGQDLGRKIALDSSNNVFVTGYSTKNDQNGTMVIWKYTSAGILDSSFDTDGIMVENNIADGNGSDSGFDISLDTSGNIFVTGQHTMNSLNNDMVIWKYKPDGVLDSNFGTDGIVLYDGDEAEDNSHGGYGMTLDNSGNLYITGLNWYKDEFDIYCWNMALWKYE